MNNIHIMFERKKAEMIKSSFEYFILLAHVYCYTLLFILRSRNKIKPSFLSFCAKITTDTEKRYDSMIEWIK